jgi:hypothetical protein
MYVPTGEDLAPSMGRARQAPAPLRVPASPYLRVCHKRAGLSLLSAVTNKGELRWMVVDGAVNASTLIRFFQRLNWRCPPKGPASLSRAAPEAVWGRGTPSGKQAVPSRAGSVHGSPAPMP